MKQVNLVLALVLALASGAMLAACATTNPPQTPESVQTSVANTAQSVLVEQVVGQAIDTLSSQAAMTQQASQGLEESSVATRVAATILAIQPSATVTPVPPTATNVAPSATPTWTAVPPTATSAAPTQSPTLLPQPLAPAISTIRPSNSKYPAPFLARPAKWQIIVGPNTDLTFAWRSSVLLAADERFIVYTRSTFDYNGGGWSDWCPTGWTQDTEWTSTGDWRAVSPGCFGEMMKGVQKVIQWKVVIQRFVNDRIGESLSPETEPWEFIWKASS